MTSKFSLNLYTIQPLLYLYLTLVSITTLSHSDLRVEVTSYGYDIVSGFYQSQ